LEKLGKCVFSSKISQLLLYQKIELKKRDGKQTLPQLFKISLQEREHLQIFSQSFDENDNSSSTRPKIHLTNASGAHELEIPHQWQSATKKKR
jgi:hypothetical protein